MNTDRRTVLRMAGGTLVATALAGCTGGSDDSDDGTGGNSDDGGGGGDVPARIDDYLSGAQSYDGGIDDHTGEDEVTVEVGAGDSGLAFDPPALRVDAGTTVIWEWTGAGGGHNVVSADESDTDFESGDLVGEAGHTFEQSFDDAGVQLYYCNPHQAQGMLGAVEVR